MLGFGDNPFLSRPSLLALSSSFSIPALFLKDIYFFLKNRFIVLLIRYNAYVCTSVH